MRGGGEMYICVYLYLMVDRSVSTLLFPYSYQGAEESKLGGDIRVAVNSFKGVMMVVRVTRKPGMESASLLSDDEGFHEEGTQDVEEGGLWNTVSKWVLEIKGCKHVCVHF